MSLHKITGECGSAGTVLIFNFLPVLSNASSNVVDPLVNQFDFLAHATESNLAPVLINLGIHTYHGSSQAVIFLANCGINNFLTPHQFLYIIMQQLTHPQMYPI